MISHWRQSARLHSIYKEDYTILTTPKDIKLLPCIDPACCAMFSIKLCKYYGTPVLPLNAVWTVRFCFKVDFSFDKVEVRNVFKAVR